MKTNMFNLQWGKTLFAGVLLASGLLGCSPPREAKMLIFSRTEGFRHSSIEPGVEALTKIAKEKGLAVEHGEDADLIREEILKDFNLVVFLNTTGDILDERQQADFQRFVQAGGGFLGIHAASDTEYQWEWYGRFVGAYFSGHPQIQEATLNVVQTHISTDSLPASFTRTDEWYNFKNINEDIQAVITIDESTYEGGDNGDFHPISWYHEFDGGRMFYTAMGHTNESYSEDLFLTHIRGAIDYLLTAAKPLNFGQSMTQRIPEKNRFQKVTLADNLDEPTEMVILPDNKVIFCERKGLIMQFDPETGLTDTLATLEVHTVHEDGLMGISLDPDFKNNAWIYLYYSVPGEQAKQRLSRFTYEEGTINLESEINVLEVPTQRLECCHTGGSMAWDSLGNLYLSTGDNTNPFESDGFGPMDGREGRSPFDARSSSANTNDLRGKILRIHPNEDGSYSIPEGNLFPPGTEGTRPEIYVMGNRNPYRISYDLRRGFLYWGEVGPDAGEDSVGRGPRGHDEINQARSAGNFGWPLFVADNKAYNRYDFTTQESGEKFDFQKPINNSVHNTGLIELPPAKPAFIWYPYDVSEEFPHLGKGGRNAMAGPIYYEDRYAPEALSETRLPSYYNGKLLVYDWMRGWVFSISVDEQGDLEAMVPFIPNIELNNPIDIEIGPDGVLYVLEYGTKWFSQNEDARLNRIDFVRGNRAPIVMVQASQQKGQAPLEVMFSSEGTRDDDFDEVTYSWDFGDGNISEDPNPGYTFLNEGIFEVKLEVNDSQGNRSSKSMEIWVGNSVPEVEIQVENNRSFFWPNLPIRYTVSVTDNEDGSTIQGSIQEDQVAFTADLIEEGFDETLIAQGHQEPLAQIVGKQLIDGSDCSACHLKTERSIGPSYEEVASKYHSESDAVAYLSSRIIAGGGGVWGDQAMAAHPQLSESEAVEMVEYIMSLGDEPGSKLPLKGQYNPKLAPASLGARVVLRASYLDGGKDPIPGILGEATVVLRRANLGPFDIVEGDGFSTMAFGDTDIAILEHNGYVTFPAIDLNGIGSITLQMAVPKGADVGIQMEDAQGNIFGKGTVVTTGKETPQDGTFFATCDISSDSRYYGDLLFRVITQDDEISVTLLSIEFVREKPKT